MALLINASSELAYGSFPWSSGSITLAFWFRRTVTTSRGMVRIVETADATDSSTPRISIGTGSGSTISAGVYNVTGSSAADVAPGTYAGSTWQHAAVVVNVTGTTPGDIECFLNGTGSGSPGISGGSLVGLDKLQIGDNSVSHSNVEIAHLAYWNEALSGAQITELQTTLPSAVGTPVGYWPLLADDNNAGSGGATYDLTLSGATIDSTNDGSLPALGGGGSTGKAIRGALMGVF